MHTGPPGTADQNVFVSILAGGSGTRLWPLSRRSRPKHLIGLTGKSTLLQETVRRVRPIVPDDHIFVVTIRDHVSLIREQLPFVPEENLVVEPAPRGTGPCLGLAALHLLQRDSSAIMVSLHADHVVQLEDRFRELIIAATQASGDGRLVTMGIVPTYPETGYGYIHRGEQVRELDGETVFRVRRFTEKPSPNRARAFVESGEYFWNSGYFVWHVGDVLAEMKRLLPKRYEQLMRIGSSLGTEKESAVVESIWPRIEPVTIDVGVMEGAADVVVLPADIGWSDVGSWASLADVLKGDEHGNVVVRKGELVALDTTGTVIHGGSRLVAMLGVRDLVVIDTEDVLLVCPKDRAQDVRKLVDELKQRGEDHLV